jgi:hypothetical protein
MVRRSAHALATESSDLLQTGKLIVMTEGKQLFNTVSALRYSDLGQKVSLPGLKKELRKFNLSSVLVALAQINTLVSLKKVNREGFSHLSDYLVDNYFDLDIRSNPKFVAARHSGHPIFGRQHLLALMRFGV